MEKKKYDHKEMPRLTPVRPLDTISVAIIDDMIKRINEMVERTNVVWKPSITCGICQEDHHLDEVKHLWTHLGKPMTHHDKLKFVIDDVAEKLRKLV